jgi:alkylhydroperoxidase family enzyme
MTSPPSNATLLPLSDDAWPASIAAMKDGFAGQLNVYRVMAHHPPLLAAWEGLRNHVVRGNALSLQQLEVVILRTGHRWDADYEWAHHVVRGLRAGLSEVRIRRTCLEAEARDNDEDGLLIRAVDALVDEGVLDPALLDALRAAVGAPGVLDLMATVGLYTTLAFIVKTFETPLDEDISAALAGVPQLAARAPFDEDRG